MPPSLLHHLHNFNPRSSCEERPGRMTRATPALKFQSTLLMRGATTALYPQNHFCPNFNPRSSCEERRKTCVAITPGDISIHAPHARSDIKVVILG